jgi:hypothetical protein
MGATLKTRPASFAPHTWTKAWTNAWKDWWTQLLALTAQLEGSPRSGLALWGCWGLTRVALLLVVVFGHAYCDPQFYHYAGQLAAGHWPYRDVPVEYPPLALVLILLPALALLPFAGIAPRPDPAFALPAAGITHLPHPDPLRYGAYAISFAAFMLLCDALTLALVMRAGRRLAPGDTRGLRSGVVYVLLTLASGALLQKFDLVAGTCCLAAVYALATRRPRLGWAALALATLVKGFPVLAAPLFIAYALLLAPAAGGISSGGISSGGISWRERLLASRREISGGIAAFCGVVAIWTLPVLVAAGSSPLTRTLLYHESRGIEIESLYANAMLSFGWLPGLALHTSFNGADLSRVVHFVNPALDNAVAAVATPVSLALLAALVLAVYAGAVRAGARLAAAHPEQAHRGLVAPCGTLMPGHVLGGLQAPNTSCADCLEPRQMTAAAASTVKAGSCTPFPEREGGAGVWVRLDQLLLAGVVAVLLAFMLAFRALPAHYILSVLPLVAVLRLPQRQLTALLWSAVILLALMGQGLTLIWHGLVSLEPGAVAVLTLRNAAWIVAYGVVLAMLWGVGPAAPVAAPANPAGEDGDMNTTIAPPKPRVPEVTPPTRRVKRAWRRLRSSTPPIPGFTPRTEDVFAHLFARIPPLHLILAAGTLSLVVYLTFVATFPITTWWSHPQLAIEMGRVTDYSPFAAAGYVCAILALFACQFFTLFAVTRLPQCGAVAERAQRLARRAVFAFPVVFVLVMIWMQPITTTDLYGYIARGYLYVHAHLNPMIYPAQQLPGGLTVDRPAAPYGPLWLLIAAGIVRVAGENLLANMLLFKLVAALAVLGAMLLVDALGRTLWPGRRLRVFVLFAWSPLVVFEAVGNGHNDIVMMLCVLAAFALMLRGRARSALALLVLGGLIKYVSFVLVPLWLVYELRRRSVTPAPPVATPEPTSPGSTASRWCARLRHGVRSVVRSVEVIDRREVAGLLASATVVGGVLVALCYAPFWDGMRTFTGLGQQLRPLYYNGSLVQFVAAPLEAVLPPSQYLALDKTVRLAFYVVFALYGVLQTRRLWQLGPAIEVRDVITAAAKIIFAALLLITFWFQPWYVVWLLPLAALAREPFVRRQGAVLAAGALLTYAVSNYFPVGTSGIGRDLFVQFFEVLITFAPLLLLRAAPYQDGWGSIVRQYARAAGEGLRFQPMYWERAMLALVLIVAALLRLLRLGDLFAALPRATSSSGALREVSADLKLYLADPRGLHSPFVALQGLMVHLFGRTPLAALLPAAVIGTLTVLVIYLLAYEVTRQENGQGMRGVALLAALFAATSGWHVSLSRSGMELVLLPLLVSTGVYCLLLGLRLNAVRIGAAVTPKPPAIALPTASGSASAATPAVPSMGLLSGDHSLALGRRCLLLFAACGLCTGLACDIAPGLWLLPLLVAGVLLAWRWRRPGWFVRLRVGLLVLLGTAVVSGMPAIWTFLSGAVGFPAGSLILAHSRGPTPTPVIVSAAFWERVVGNGGSVLHVLIAQDYSAGYPASGGTPILPAGLGWLFFLGLALVLVRWRSMTSLALVLLIALPLLASMAVSAPAGVIEAAAVLPATCIVPAVALYALAVFLGHLPIVLDRIHGTRVFSSPEQIGRILLLVFLVVATLRTFFWYFEATLPSTPPNQWIPT